MNTNTVLKRFHQTPSIESRNVYNVKAKGLTWNQVPTLAKVDADAITRDLADGANDEKILAKSWGHNKYYAPYRPKVNKEFRLWNIDLDKEQYNHLKIPVNTTLQFSAPQYAGIVGRGMDDTAKKCDGVKFLNKKYTPIEQLVPIKENRTWNGNQTVPKVNMIDRTPIDQSSGIKSKYKKRVNGRETTRTKDILAKNIMVAPNDVNRSNVISKDVGVKMVDKELRFMGNNIKCGNKEVNSTQTAKILADRLNPTMSVIQSQPHKNFGGKRGISVNMNEIKDRVDEFQLECHQPQLEYNISQIPHANIIRK